VYPLTKYLFLYLLLQLPGAFNLKAGVNPAKDSVPKGSVSVVMINHRLQKKKDSTFITFDRWDHTRPGVVCAIFYPAKDGSIMVDKIPDGKYFVTIQFLGASHVRFEKAVRIKAGRCKDIELELPYCDTFSKGKSNIPEAVVDLSRLRIVNMK